MCEWVAGSDVCFNITCVLVGHEKKAAAPRSPQNGIERRERSVTFFTGRRCAKGLLWILIFILMPQRARSAYNFALHLSSFSPEWIFRICSASVRASFQVLKISAAPSRQIALLPVNTLKLVKAHAKRSRQVKRDVRATRGNKKISSQKAVGAFLTGKLINLPFQMAQVQILKHYIE